jgi:arylsulfatase A-like enzyme
MIARWPGVVTPGTTSDVPVSNVDFYPTFLTVAGAPAPASVLDGENLLPLFRGETKLQRQALYWHFPGYLDNPVLRGRDPAFRTRAVSVIRKGDWKLHLYHEEWQLDGGREKLATNRAAELYNIANDGGERTDLAATTPAKRDELLDDLLAWMKSTGAVLPMQPNRDYDPKAPAKGGKKKPRGQMKAT